MCDVEARFVSSSLVLSFCVVCLAVDVHKIISNTTHHVSSTTITPWIIMLLLLLCGLYKETPYYLVAIFCELVRTPITDAAVPKRTKKG